MARGGIGGRRRRRASGRVLAGLAAAGALIFGCIIAAPSGPALAVSLPCDGHSSGSAPATDYDPTYHRSQADTNKPITPKEALARGNDWIAARPSSGNAPGIYYCQSGTYPDRHGVGYRTDCSGFVSMAWQITPIGLTAWTSMYAVAHPISWDQMQPGDAVHNPDHIELVEKVDREHGLVQTEAFGHTPPHRTVYTWAALVSEYNEAIRYNKMVLVDDGMIRKQVQKDTPRSTVGVQPPNGQTLTNLPTYFYMPADDPDHNVENHTFDETVWMADHTVQVQIQASRTRYAWHFGDTKQVKHTTYPGETYPYKDPSKTIMHLYTGKTGATPYKTSVDVSWGHIRYRILQPAGMQPGWHDVGGPDITIVGPPTDLTVKESHPVLGSPN